MSDIVNRFAALFAGRTDAFGTEQGGCFRPDEAAFKRMEYWVDRHLSGTEPIGVYPMVPAIPSPESTAGISTEWRVKWGCVDLDVKGPTHATGYDSHTDALEAAQNLINALKHFGVTGWIERTRSGGYHVWVFARQWVPAAIMRRALLIGCAVADIPPTEVNPKSEGFDSPDVLGNYVRLPYPGVLTNSRDVRQHRLVCDERGVPYNLDDFIERAEQALADETTLSSMADLYTPPHTESNVVINSEVELDETLRRRLSGLTWTVLRDGPLEGQDRSGSLYRLAHLCRADDLDPDETFAVVKAGDEAWGKFHRRPNGDRYLKEIVEKAWSE